MKKKNTASEIRSRILYLEAALILLLFPLSFSFFVGEVFAGVGENVTVTTGVTVGSSNPNIILIDVESGTVSLTPNASTVVNCSVIVEDYDGEADVLLVNATFFDTTNSNPADPDDNNTHYTNASCDLSTGYGDSYQVMAHCLFDVEYYANPGNWNCSVYVEDQATYTENETNSTTIEEMLAFGLPDTIDYGTINATFVSNEQAANVTNVGNVMANLSLSGYGASEGDGYSMVCDYGSVQNISIDYEKYNLTASTPGDLSLTHFEGNYTNLTDTPTINEFNLDYRTNETANDRINTTYWRVYVPVGVAGSCNGTIIFGAIKADA